MISLILQSYNHRNNVNILAERLKLIPDAEVIICEDGSSDGSDKLWLKYKKDFKIIFTDNLHEIRSYNNASKVARGEILCFLQDDDILPNSSKWVIEALDLMKRHDLSILGGSLGRKLNKNGAFGEYNGVIQDNPIPYGNFMFIENVNLAPFFIKKKVFEKLGGFDERYSKQGESGVYLDFDLSTRAWLKNYKVGLYHIADLKRGVGGRMSFKSNREENAEKNRKIFDELYGNKFKKISEKVDKLNKQFKKVVKRELDIRYQDITFIIITENDSAVLTSTIKKLMQQNLVPNILIYDTGSVDGTAEMIQKQIDSEFWDGTIKLIVDKKKKDRMENRTQAHNDALKNIGTKYIFFLHPRVILPKYCIAPLIERMEEKEALGMLGIQYEPDVDHVQMGATLMRTEEAKKINWGGAKGCICRSGHSYLRNIGKLYKHDFRFMARNYKGVLE